MPIGRRVCAELLGTLVLVLGGCGASLLSGAMPGPGIGHLGVALAFGATLTALMFALGHVSGAHLNPAVTLGMYVARKLPAKDVMPYMLAQLAGAIVGAAVLFLLAAGKPGFVAGGAFEANGFGELSPGGFSLGSVMLAEVLLTFFFVLVVTGTADRRSLAPTAPIAAGAAFAVVHLVGIPLDRGSFNPARSVATAIFEGGRSIYHVWLFVLAPLAGGSLAGAAMSRLARSPARDPDAP